MQGWVKSIRDKPETLVRAIRDAQAATNYMDWKAGIITDKEYQKTVASTMEVREKARERER